MMCNCCQTSASVSGIILLEAFIELRKEITAMNEVVDHLATEVAETRASVEAAETRLGQLSSSVADLSAQIADLIAQIAANAADQAAVEALTGQLDALQQELDATVAATMPAPAPEPTPEPTPDA